MATQQPIFFKTIDTKSTTATEYIPINTNNQAWHVDESRSIMLVPTAGKFVEMNIKIDTAPSGASKKYTFSLMVNGVASTTLTGDITDTATTLTVTMDQSISAGDRVSLESDPVASPAAFGRIDGNFIWEPTTDDEYIYMGGHPSNTLNNASEEWSPLNGGAHTWGGSRNKRAQTMPTAGTIKKLAIFVDGSPGVGKTFTFTVDKDGTGSTETVVIDDGDENVTQFNNNDIWTITAGDNMAFSCVPASTPDIANAICSCVFVPTTTGQIPLLGGSGDNAMNIAATEYMQIGEQQNLTGTRTSVDLELVNVNITFETFYVQLNSACGGDGYDCNLEIDTVSDETIDVAIAGTGTAFNTTGASVDVVAGEKLSIELVPDAGSAPTSARTIQYGLLFTFGAAPPAAARVIYQGIYNSSGMI